MCLISCLIAGCGLRPALLLGFADLQKSLEQFWHVNCAGLNFQFFKMELVASETLLLQFSVNNIFAAKLNSGRP